MSSPTDAKASSDSVLIGPAPAEHQIFTSVVAVLASLVRHKRDHLLSLFPLLIYSLCQLIGLLRHSSVASNQGAVPEIEDKAGFPLWARTHDHTAIMCADALSRLLAGIAARPGQSGNNLDAGRQSSKTVNLGGPLSKHGSYLLLAYLRACAHPRAAISATVRHRLEPGLHAVIGTMGKYERDALMQGILTKDDEAERGILRGLIRSIKKERPT